MSFDSTALRVGDGEEALLNGLLFFFFSGGLDFFSPHRPPPRPLLFSLPAFNEVTQATPARLGWMLELTLSQW